jgi:hypothetical protein
MNNESNLKTTRLNLDSKLEEINGILKEYSFEQTV